MIMSVFLGIVGSYTLYFWWSIDWWHPQNITGTIFGIEDFITGFASGGIMSVFYEVVFQKKYCTRINDQTTHRPRTRTILFLLFFITATLIWGFRVHSFWASVISMALISSVIIYFRKDLVAHALLTGVGMVVASLFFYYPIIVLYPEWVSVTYDQSLSGIKLSGIPVEELVFWFLSGVLWGPLYKYWKNEQVCDPETVTQGRTRLIKL